MGFENKYIPLSQLLVTVYLIESFFILFGKAEKMLHQMFKYVNGGVFSWFSSQSCSKMEECCEQCLDHIQPIAVNKCTILFLVIVFLTALLVLEVSLWVVL